MANRQNLTLQKVDLRTDPRYRTMILDVVNRIGEYSSADGKSIDPATLIAVGAVLVLLGCHAGEHDLDEVLGQIRNSAGGVCPPHVAVH